MEVWRRADVVKKILPIYQRIATPELLEKCKGETKNANESLHKAIWSGIPKTRFFSLRIMEYSIYRDVVKFNHGTTALVTATGDAFLVPSHLSDRKRESTSVRLHEKKEELILRKIRKKKSRERREKGG